MRSPIRLLLLIFYWIDEKPIELIQFSNGAVYTEDEVAPVLDELQAQGITEKARRKRVERICKIRQLDGGDWLNEPQDTVFNWIPLIPIYGNYNVNEGKIIYHGAISKLYDHQRVYNYLKSREITEVALSPRNKLMLSAEQAEGYNRVVEYVECE